MYIYIYILYIYIYIYIDTMMECRSLKLRFKHGLLGPSSIMVWGMCLTA